MAAQTYFYINANAEVILIGELDFEEKKEYELTAKVTDGLSVSLKFKFFDCISIALLIVQELLKIQYRYRRKNNFSNSEICLMVFKLYLNYVKTIEIKRKLY